MTGPLIPETAIHAGTLILNLLYAPSPCGREIVGWQRFSAHLCLNQWWANDKAVCPPYRLWDRDGHSYRCTGTATCCQCVLEGVCSRTVGC